MTYNVFSGTLNPTQSIYTVMLLSNTADSFSFVWQDWLDWRWNSRVVAVRFMIAESLLEQVNKEEEEFEKQYNDWLVQYNTWKEQNKSRVFAKFLSFLEIYSILSFIFLQILWLFVTFS